MHPDYADITSKLGKPLWYFDPCRAVPRYDPFHPNLCGVYDHHVALVVIRCQACHNEFMASVSIDSMDRMQRNQAGKMELQKIVFPSAESAGGFDAWGDPPRHSHWEGACAGGDTMMSELVRIAEFWSRDHDRQSKTFLEWVRRPQYEFDYSHQFEE